MRTNSSKLTLAKTNYMIADILVFMLSTATIHLAMTYFFGDFSLTWLPPALSISEMLLVGYALLTTRFYRVKYLAYISLNSLLVCTILALPFGAIFIPLTNIGQWLMIIPIGALIGITWHRLYKLTSNFASFLIYGTKITSVQQILALEENFKLSIDNGIHNLGNLLQIPNDKLRLINCSYSEVFYENYLSSNEFVLLFDELSEELGGKVSAKHSIKTLYNKMNSNNTALVMPLFNQSKSITHLLCITT